MAATPSHLTTQLQTKLSDGNVSLDERLVAAQTVFCSSDIPILQKEEQVLSWILSVLQNEMIEMNQRELCYTCLLHCFKSKRFKNFSGTLKPNVVTGLLDTLEIADNYSDGLKTAIRQCCIEVLQISFFQRWFMCDVDSLCKLTRKYLMSIMCEKSMEDFPFMVDQFLYIHKMSLLKNDLRYRFVKYVLKELCKALSISHSTDVAKFHAKATLLLKEVLFSDPKFISSYIMINLDIQCEDDNKEAKSFNKKLKHLPSKESREIVEVFYCLFLKTVISKYPDDFNRVFRVFIFLCRPLGIIVNETISIEMNPISNWTRDDSFYVITKLVDVLEKSKIPITCELKEISLKNWFTGLVIGLLNINNKTFSVNFFNMVKQIFEFNPLVIMPASKAMTMVMLQIKTPEIKPSYVELLKCTIEGSSKIQRLQKFVSYFLQSASEYLGHSTSEDDLTLEDVLPEEVLNQLRESIPMIPASQIFSMTQSLLFHLKRDCLPLVEAYQTESSVCVFVEVMSEMLCQLIYGTNMVDHSVAEVIKVKFKNVLEELQVLLKRFGDVYVEIHDDRLLKSYLHLCRAFGSIKLLFREYDNIQIAAPTEVDLEATNICYVHNYLFPENWMRIAQLIECCDSCEARHEFFGLLVQKIEAVAQVEEGYEGPGTQVARYLLEKADMEWLWEHLIVLAPLFQSAELLKLIHKLINFLGADQTKWLPLLKIEAFTENRRVLLATAFRLMSKASKKLRSDQMTEGDDVEEEPVSRQVLSLITDVDLLEYELAQLITDDIELKEKIEEAAKEMSLILNEKLPCKREYECNLLPNTSYLEVTARLPLQHLSTMSQHCTLVCALSLLHDLPNNSDANMFLCNLILKILDGPKKYDALLLGEINPGTFLRFIFKKGENFIGLKKLMKRTCMTALQSKSTAKKLMKDVSKPSSEKALLTAMTIDCLMLMKNKYLGGSGESKKPIERKKCIEHLVSELVPIVCDGDPTPDHLYPYSVVFNATFYCKAQPESFTILRKSLKYYIQFAMKDYNSGRLLVESMMRHRVDLKKDFPSDLVNVAWDNMRLDVFEPPEAVIHVLFGIATPEEFKNIVSSLVASTEAEVKKEIVGHGMVRLLNLWSCMASFFFSNDKSFIRDQAFVLLSQQLLALAGNWKTSSHSVPSVMEFISTMANNTSVGLQPVVVDTCLELLGDVPLPADDPHLLLSNLNASLDAMFALYLFRTSLLMDRLPALLQRYRSFLKSLAPVVDPSKATESIIKLATPVADKLERAATTMAKRHQDFTRLAPYLISDVMTIFQKQNLLSDVKFSYTNIVKAFISICDDHGITYLKGALPIGQQELFNNIYENYNKYNRYVGKI